jgi:enamine deaminase RidA (YjgF/YER057c/UK114 family)
MQKPPGYSHVVEVTGPGRTVYFAGQLGIDKSGKMGANTREQMEIAFENVKAALASVGATFDNVKAGVRASPDRWRERGAYAQI